MAQCYDWNSETQQTETLPTNIWLPCPAGNTCCIGGSVCLDHNLCHVPGASSSTDGSYSSYYVARCTDPTYTSPDCQKVCDAPGPPDAVYNYSSQQWNCCGKDSAGNVSCNNPTSEIFQAPAPLDLRELSSGVAIVSTATLASGTRTSSSTSIQTSTSASSSTSSASPTTTRQPASSSSSNSNSLSTSSSSNSSGLSTGAKAGIGVGVALVILLALSALLFFLLRRRRRSRAAGGTGSAMVYNGGACSSSGKGSSSKKRKSTPYDSAAPVYVEKDGESERQRVELGAGRDFTSGRVHEIGSSG